MIKNQEFHGESSTPKYNPETYLRLADTVASLTKDECHSDFYDSIPHVVGRLWEAADSPSHPRNHRLLNALPLFIYVPLHLYDDISPKH